tara:strand:- start:319 stop:1104 length:786 start_codon:yes stop_codon:yes gene_type:complete
LNPTNQNSWELIEKSQDSFFISKILKNHNFKHGFFTRLSKDRTIKDLSINLGNGITTHQVDQIHSNIIIKAKETRNNILVPADGITSDDKNQSLWIYTADCIPVLIANTRNGNVSACHVGWKGIANRITINAIKKLTLKENDIKNIVIAMGPSISINNYQVDLNTAKEIYASLYNKKRIIPLEFSYTTDRLKSLGIIKLDNQRNKVKLDIRLALQEQLINEGIIENKISICPLCTFKNKSLFFSRRRQISKEIQWSAIVSQ